VAVLAFEGVEKTYGGVPALRGVSLEVRSGETFGLLGPNGAGKTSLIRIALDILRADAGRVEVLGAAPSPEQQDRIGYLPEERGLYRRERVLDVLSYFGQLKGLDRKDARRTASHWLERVGLSDIGRFRIDRLSKGMSQKVQIAAALMTDPDLCILDEPFSGLDPVNSQLVKEILAERRASGRATILSTHRMAEVETLCDRVALVHRGRRVLYGGVEEVRAAHSQPELRLRLDGPLPSLPMIETSVQQPNGSWLVRLADDADPSELLATLVQGGHRVTHFERVLAPLEQVFVDVVQREAA
jgi:ABC-2 type transport system ATP-binding protein